MEYRPLGRTDLKVSAVMLGTMTWGEQNSEAEGHAQMDLALERGVTFWDTAEMYPVAPRAETYGRTEEIIGTWLASRGGRDHFFDADVAAHGRQIDREPEATQRLRRGCQRRGRLGPD